MARKPANKKAGSSADPMTRILTAVMQETAAVGWARLSMEAVAKRAGLKLGDVLIHVPTTAHVLAHFADHVDKVALSSVDGVDASQSVRDRLFDLLMRRFDALQAHRAGVVALMSAVTKEPGEGAMLLARLSRSMSATLSAAGVSPHGLKGLAQIMGLKAVYLSGLRAWKNDGSADMAKTMAALDKALGVAEQAANFSLGGLMKRRARAEKKED
jgi:AcrR family transcriptional regulator